MTELEKIQRFDEIKILLDTLDRESQRKIVWAHLSYLLQGDIKGVGWLLERTGEIIDRESNNLLAPFQ